MAERIRYCTWQYKCQVHLVCPSWPALDLEAELSDLFVRGPFEMRQANFDR
jgi:hypothetical protein